MNPSKSLSDFPPTPSPTFGLSVTTDSPPPFCSPKNQVIPQNLPTSTPPSPPQVINNGRSLNEKVGEKLAKIETSSFFVNSLPTCLLTVYVCRGRLFNRNHLPRYALALRSRATNYLVPRVLFFFLASSMTSLHSHYCCLSIAGSKSNMEVIVGTYEQVLVGFDVLCGEDELEVTFTYFK